MRQGGLDLAVMHIEGAVMTGVPYGSFGYDMVYYGELAVLRQMAI